MQDQVQDDVQYAFVGFYKSKQVKVLAVNHYQAKEKIIKELNVPHHKVHDLIVVPEMNIR